MAVNWIDEAHTGGAPALSLDRLKSIGVSSVPTRLDGITHPFQRELARAQFDRNVSGPSIDELRKAGAL